MTAHAKYNKLSFMPTYYEWELYDTDKNGNIEPIYTWDDFSDDVSDNMTMNDAEEIADDLMYEMEMSYNNDGCDLDPTFIDDAKKVIAAAIYKHYAA